MLIAIDNTEYIFKNRVNFRNLRGSGCLILCCTPAIYRSIHFRKEKALEGKSKTSHSVHCPFFPDDKQEHWWCYIADRKNHALITPPNHVTALIDREEVELKFTAPQKPGTYTIYLGPSAP